MNEYDYMKGLWAQFYTGPTSLDEPTPEGSKEDRKRFLRMMDRMNYQCEIISLNSFIAGFQLAAGIAREITRSAYSFVEAEEERARNS